MSLSPRVLYFCVFAFFILASCLAKTSKMNIPSSSSSSYSSFLDLPECASAAGIPTRDTRQINQLLHKLVSNSTFFSLYSVDLDKPCPFWADDAICVIRDCSVHSCEEDEIPPMYQQKQQTICPSPSSPSSQEPQQHQVDRSLTGLAALVGPPPCVATENKAWTSKDDNDKSVYVDLRRNPERYTGYSGESAQKVWNAIYSENCFTFSAKCSSGICSLDTCKEERVLYKLISGLHASISTHIAKQYFYQHLNYWGVNTKIYKERLLVQRRERISNLQVVYAIVLRAMAKAAPYLKSIEYETGNKQNDQLTKSLLNDFFSNDLINPTCEHKVFDESDMFLRDQQHLLPEFRAAFRNISMIMDCVGCEKCKLWGKLQFLGLGTAMRILFEKDMPQFERNDIIALVNLLYKLSTSVLWVEILDQRIEQQGRMYFKLGIVAAIIGVFLLSSYIHKGKKKDKKENGNENVNITKKNSANGEESTTSSIMESEDTRTEVNGEMNGRETSKWINGKEDGMGTPKKQIIESSRPLDEDDKSQNSALRRSARLQRKRNLARAD